MRVAYVPAIDQFRCRAIVHVEASRPYTQRCPHAVVPGADLCRSHQNREWSGQTVVRVRQPEVR